MVVHGDSHHHQSQNQSRHHEDSLTRKRRKQLHTTKWVQEQGGYQYPLEQDLGDFGKHTSDNPPSPPASQKGGLSPLLKDISRKSGQRGSRLAARAAAINNSSKLRNRAKMSSDIATQRTNRAEGAPNKKNLSAAGAATSLKRAEPRQLPSFPSHGLADLEASAGAAASLAAAHPTHVEQWKPDSLPAAGAAASLAHASTSPEIGKPETSASASASAATALARDHHYKATEATLEGRGSRSASDAKMPGEYEPSAGKAAAQIAHSNSPSTSPKMQRLCMVKTSEDDSASMTAATGAMGQSRNRAGSLPSAPQQQNSTSVNHALTAASLASRPTTQGNRNVSSSQSRPAYDIQKINRLAQDKVTRDLHGSRDRHNPQQQQQQQQQQHQKQQAQEARTTMEAGKAASLSMRKTGSTSSRAENTRYSMPTTMRRSQAQQSSTSSTVDTAPSQPSKSDLSRRDSMMAASAATAHLIQRQQQEKKQEEQQQQQTREEARSRPYYPNLDEAARKQAAERLRRLAEDHEKNRRGLGLSAARYQGQHSRSAVSDRHDSESSKKIKSEMDALERRMAEVDRMKQVRDNAALIAKAQRNVQQQMQSIDTKVAQDKGHIPKHLQDQWDVRAKEASLKAESKRNEDQAAKHGKIDIGGGVWFSQEELDKIAAANVKPLLDDIAQSAALQRAKEEEIRLDKEESERKKKLEADRKREIKQDEKNAKLAAKQIERQKKEQEKQEKHQQKELEKQEKQHQREGTCKVKEEEKANKQYEQRFAQELATGASGGAAADVEERRAAAIENDGVMDQPQSTERSIQKDNTSPVAQQTDNKDNGGKDKEGWLHSFGWMLSRKNKEKHEPGQFHAGIGTSSGDGGNERDDNSIKDVALAGTEHTNASIISAASQPLSSDDVSEVSSISREETRTSFQPLTSLSPPKEHTTPSRGSTPEPAQEEAKKEEDKPPKVPKDADKEERENVDEDVKETPEEPSEAAAPLTSATYIPGQDAEPFYEQQNNSSSASVQSAKSSSAKSASSRGKEDSKRRSLAGLLKKPFWSKKEAKEESSAKQESAEERPEIIRSVQTSSSKIPEDDDRPRDTFGNMFKRSEKGKETDLEARKQQHREAEVPDVSVAAENPKNEDSADEFSEAQDFFDDNTVDMPCQVQRAFEGVRKNLFEQSSAPNPADPGTEHSQVFRSRFAEQF